MVRHEVYVSARPFAFRFVAEYSVERTARPSLLSSPGDETTVNLAPEGEAGGGSNVRKRGAEVTGRGKQRLRRCLRGDVHNSAVMPWVSEDVHTLVWDFIKSKVSQCYYYLPNSRDGTWAGSPLRDELYSTIDIEDNLTSQRTPLFEITAFVEWTRPVLIRLKTMCQLIHFFARRTACSVISN